MSSEDYTVVTTIRIEAGDLDRAREIRDRMKEWLMPIREDHSWFDIAIVSDTEKEEEE